jgi:hypothetical protein
MHPVQNSIQPEKQKNISDQIRKTEDRQKEKSEEKCGIKLITLQLIYLYRGEFVCYFPKATN